MFLIETKISDRKMEGIRLQCDYKYGIDISAEGSKGGLSLGWNEEIDRTLKSFYKWHIDVDLLVFMAPQLKIKHLTYGAC